MNESNDVPHTTTEGEVEEIIHTCDHVLVMTVAIKHNKAWHVLSYPTYTCKLCGKHYVDWLLDGNPQESDLLT